MKTPLMLSLVTFCVVICISVWNFRAEPTLELSPAIDSNDVFQRYDFPKSFDFQANQVDPITNEGLGYQDLHLDETTRSVFDLDASDFQNNTISNPSFAEPVVEPVGITGTGVQQVDYLKSELSSKLENDQGLSDLESQAFEKWLKPSRKLPISPE